RRTRQLHDLVGLVVSQLGFVKLLGRFVQRSNARLFRVFLALIASGSLVHPLNVTLEWEPSTETDVVGYVLYQGVAGTGYIKATDVGNQTSATVTNLVCGITNFFCIAAYDADRIEGNPSNLIGTNCPGPYPPPTIAAIPAQLIGANSSAGPIPLSIDDALFGASTLKLTTVSSNPVLVPEGNILVGGSDSNRTLTVVPALHEVGSAEITVTVEDGIASASTSFVVIVDPSVQPALVYFPIEAESGTLVAPMVQF